MAWDIEPFEGLRKLREDMDRMFNKAFESLPASKEFGKGFRMPKADVQETENSVIATIELPGVEKENIDLNISEKSIEVKAKKKQEKEEKGKEKYSYSKSSSQFYRRVPLPAEVNSDEANAVYKNGVLKVQIPKTKKEKKKKINIK